MPLPKIFVLGAGNVGAASAAAMAARRLGRIYLYDTVEGLAIGKAMDINHASPFFHSDSRVIGCDALDDLVRSDVVVITAGVPRKAGQSRADLLSDNATVALDLAERVLQAAPDAKVLVVSNPVDLLTWVLTDRFSQLDVLGLGCSLDTLRLRYFLAETAGVSVDSVSAIVIGMHSNAMIPLIRHATLGGAPVSHVLGDEQMAEVVARTRSAGTDIVAHLKTRGSFYAASYCVAEIVEAIVRDTKAVFPLSTVCDGHYGHEGTVLALPAMVGADGVEEILQIDLDADEQAALDACAATCREAFEGLS